MENTNAPVLNAGLADVTILRSFGLGQDGNPTKIGIVEWSDGSIGISLVTDRDGFEPLETSFRVSHKTFALLTDALLRAAHNPEIWKSANV